MAKMAKTRIITTMKKLMLKLHKYYVIARVSLSNTINYRAPLIAGFLAYTLYIYVFMGLWRAIYRESDVRGYTYTQIVWYLTMTELVGFFAGSVAVYRVMNDDVKSGSIAYLIGRPVHYIAYQLANSAGQAAFNFLTYGALAALLGLAFVGPLPGFSPINIPAIFVSFALGFILQFFLMMLIGLSAFFIEDNFAMYLIFSKLTFMLGTFLPVEFLPSWLSPIAKALPFSYISWAPAKLFVDFSPALFAELVPIQAMWAALMLAITLLCYRAGARSLQINGG